MCDKIDIRIYHFNQVEVYISEALSALNIFEYLRTGIVLVSLPPKIN